MQPKKLKLNKIFTLTTYTPNTTLISPLHNDLGSISLIRLLDWFVDIRIGVTNQYKSDLRIKLVLRSKLEIKLVWGMR